MRKIGSEAEMEKKRKLSVFIISIFFLVILVLGTVGYAFIYSPAPLTTTDQQIPDGVVSNGDQWLVRFEGQNFILSNSPESVSHIPIEGEISLNDFAGKNFYIASEDNAVATEVASVLSRYALRIQEACHGACDDDLPEKECSTDDLIVITNNQEQRVYKDQNCVFIQGGVQSADAFIYHLLGM